MEEIEWRRGGKKERRKLGGGTEGGYIEKGRTYGHEYPQRQKSPIKIGHLRYRF